MIKLHIGCGKRNFGKSWVHIDGANYNHIDYHDITKLKFDNESVDLIYASHVLEYFDRDEAINLLLEWKRVLKTGAILRIAVPDFESMSKLYTDKKIKLNQILGPLFGKMNMNNNFIYHKTVYDFDNLYELLNSVGMNNISKYDWRKTDHSMFDDHSQAYIPHMDKNNGTLISLNIQGIK